MKEILREDKSSLEINDQKKLRNKVIDEVLDQKDKDIETKISHEKIIKTSFDDIISLYGKEKWMKVIREHFLIEINKQRKALGNNELKTQKILDEIAQSKAKDMADNNYFDHKDKEWLTDSGRMKKDGRYNFQIFASNISYNIKSIGEVIQSYINNKKRNTGHYDVISSKDYKQLWVGLSKGKDNTWYVTINYWSEINKK